VPADIPVLAVVPLLRAAKPVFFADAAAFRAWLLQHGAVAVEWIVGLHKVGAGVASITWPDSVDEALCFGWIDGVRKRIDDGTYPIRFTPRRPGSIRSAVNLAKVAGLQAQGRMRPAGLPAFPLRTERKSSVHSYEQAGRSNSRPRRVANSRRTGRLGSTGSKCRPAIAGRSTAMSWVPGRRRLARADWRSSSKRAQTGDSGSSEPARVKRCRSRRMMLA